MATIRGNPVAWENFYKTARWRRLRKFQLMQHPLCKFCLERGIVTRANVVDHVVPHKGDWTDFITGELQSLCEPCHNSAKRQIELRGYSCDVGIDGYPIDPNHPFNRAGGSD
jgi:5-methylcytosine-specific restriction endonuclease McrA